MLSRSWLYCQKPAGLAIALAIGLSSCAHAYPLAGCASSTALTSRALAQNLSVPLPGQSESYGWGNVAIAGMGFVTGIAIHPLAPDLVYARTDVGGIYRWQAETSAWVQLLDRERDLYSVESIALDPNEPNRLYAAAGGNILRSTDRGESWQVVSLRPDNPVAMDGNGEWRWAGERLAVDPNDGEVIYFGSRSDGLFKSQNAGATWAQVIHFPSLEVPPGGLSFVEISSAVEGQEPASDLSGSSIYVGVMGEGVYHSGDGGQQWTLLAGGPGALQNPQQAAIAGDGSLYITTFTSADAPNGGVWRYRQGEWQNLTPQPGQNYSAIALTPQAPDSLVVATYPFSPQGLYRTTDGGQTWRQLTLQVDAIDWWPDWHLYTLMGGLAINPLQPSQVWLTTGFGVMRTEDITARPARWCTPMANLEELVVFSLRSPPGSADINLFSGVADMDGFHHQSLTEPPKTTYDRGRFGDTTGLDFAEADPNILVRVGSSPGAGGRLDGENRSAYSADNGETWSAFANVPTGAFNGKVAVSATLQSNGKPVIVWAPQGNVYPHRSLDGGQTWQPVEGAPNRTTLQVWFPNQSLASDRVNGNLFYLFKYGEAGGGSFYRSVNGGASWERTVTNLPDYWIHKVEAAPSLEGEVWLSVQDHSLYRSSDAGGTFVPVAQVETALTFGFGQAAPGRANPTIFVYGVIDAVEGLFRSDDATSLPGDAAEATWVKVSTDRQMLSNVTYLEGDRRQFGRIYVGTGGRGILYGQPN